MTQASRRSSIKVVLYDEIFLQEADLRPIFEWLGLEITAPVEDQYRKLLRRSAELDLHRGDGLTSAQRQYISVAAPFGLYRQLLDSRSSLSAGHSGSRREVIVSSTDARAAAPSAVHKEQDAAALVMSEAVDIESRVLAAAPTFRVPRPLNLRSDMQAPSFSFRAFNVSPLPLTAWRVKNALLKHTARTFGLFREGSEAHVPIAVKEGWEPAAWDAADATSTRSLKGTFISLVPFRGRRNYAHFLLEGLPRIFLASLWTDPGAQRRLLADGLFKEISDDFIGLLFPEAAADYLPLNGVCRVDDLIIADALKHPLHWVHPELLLRLRRLAFETTQRAPAHYRTRLYIDRGPNRGAENREDLLSLLARYDFQVLRPETMSARGQIEAFRSAELIVGEHGAGLANMIFCENPRAAAAIEIMPRRFGIPAYWLLAAGLGVNYYVVLEDGDVAPYFDEERKQDRVVVDLVRLDEAIQHALALKN